MPLTSQIVAALLVLSLASQGGCVLEEKRLHRDLLSGYNKNVRPVMNNSSPIRLKMGVALIDFTIDSETDVLDALVWLRLLWEDQYLRWIPADYGNLDQTRFSMDEIWKPDLELYNSWKAGTGLSLTSNFYPIVQHTGEVLFVPSAKYQARCSVDRTNWPRDQAKCRLKFGSWTHHGFQINMTLYKDGVDMEDLRPNGKWTVTNSSGEAETKYYTCCDEPYVSLIFKLEMTRDQHNTAAVTIPIICSGILMLLSFLVPVTSSQKLTFSWVSVFIIVIGLLNTYSMMPPDAFGQATIGVFYVTFTVILLLFAGAEVLVVCLSRPRSAPMPKCLRGLFSGVLGKFLCLDTPVFHNYTAEDSSELHDSSDGEFQRVSRDPTVSYEWSLLASAVDRLFGLVFLIIFCVCVPPNITWS